MAKYKAILLMTVCAAVLYAVNHFILQTPYFAANQYEVFKIYGFFWLCAAVVLFAVHVVHGRSPDNTGYAFLAVTLVQMVLGYLMLRPLLGAEGRAAALERNNFFIVFILFLAMETALTIRLLNNKQ